MKDNSVPELEVVYQPLGSLKNFPYNARTHSNHQIRQIARSIEAFGFTNPVLIDLNNTIIAGHGRIQAAKLLEIETVPTIRLDALTQEQIRAYIIADNRVLPFLQFIGQGSGTGRSTNSSEHAAQVIATCCNNQYIGFWKGQSRRLLLTSG